MEFQDVVHKRRMIRNFDDRPVPEATMVRILENALHAPSAGFTQGWGFLLLSTAEERACFWDIELPVKERSGPYVSMVRAPLVIIPMSNKRMYLERYAEPDKGWTDMDEA